MVKKERIVLSRILLLVGLQGGDGREKRFGLADRVRWIMKKRQKVGGVRACLLYTSDAADDCWSV